jgi:hypothetical protein
MLMTVIYSTEQSKHKDIPDGREAYEMPGVLHSVSNGQYKVRQRSNHEKRANNSKQQQEEQHYSNTSNKQTTKQTNKQTKKQTSNTYHYLNGNTSVNT